MLEDIQNLGVIRSTVEVGDDITFESYDKLGRKQFGENLANLVESCKNEGCVMSLDAPWGEGKTTFIKMWKNYLENDRDIQTICFDAFKYDYIEDPFISIAGEILKIKEEGNTKLAELKEKTKRIIPLLGKVGLRYLLRGDIPDLDNKVEGAIEGYIADFVGKSLDKYMESKAEIESFKLALEDLIKDNRPLVFIIDELDRCKPIFAIRVLEIIKHFFSVPGVVFVLSMNKGQIKEYLKHLYGNIDTNIYLQKFIDLNLVLPKKIDVSLESDSSRGSDDSLNYLKEFLALNSIIFKDSDDKEIEDIISRFSIFNKKLRFSLREVEFFINYIVMIYKTIGKDKNTIPLIIVFLSILKVRDDGLFQKIKNKDISEKKLSIVLDKLIDTETTSDNDMDIQFILYCLNLSPPEGAHFDNFLGKFNIRRSRVFPIYFEKFALYGI